jgi:hypothetical protein
MATYVRLDVEEERGDSLAGELTRRGFKAHVMKTLIGGQEVLVRKPLFARTGAFKKDVEVAVIGWLIDNDVRSVSLSQGEQEYLVAQPALFQAQTAARTSS